MTKYEPSIVFYNFDNSLDLKQGKITVSNKLIDALIMARNVPLILDEDNLSIILYQPDLIDRDIVPFLSTVLLIETAQLMSVPDNCFIYQSGSRIRAENGFLKIYKDGYIKTFSAALMAENVKRR